MKVYLRVFPDSPDIGEPGLVCSLCGRPFVQPEGVDPDAPDFHEEDDDAFPIRMWPPSGAWEARFHVRPCFEQLFTMGETGLRPQPGLELVWVQEAVREDRLEAKVQEFIDMCRRLLEQDAKRRGGMA